MAANKSKKHYPVVRSAGLFQNGLTTQNRILMAHEELSKLNRRLYRMGRYYQVKIDADHGEIGNIAVYALRDDWAVQKAFQMAYQAYLDNTSDERERLGDNMVARWEDFRVKPGIVADTIVSALLDNGLAPVALTSGEFELSNVVDSANARRTFTWGTPGTTEYGILQEYDKAANAQSQPQSLTGVSGPYSDIETQINTLTSDDLMADGNNPPYDKQGVNATTPFVKVGELGSTAGAQSLSTGFFTAPCGIVLLAGPTVGWNPSNLSMTVKAGDYKGVHAPSMVEIATVNRKRKVVK